jgi:hypothetical protein
MVSMGGERLNLWCDDKPSKSVLNAQHHVVLVQPRWPVLAIRSHTQFATDISEGINLLRKRRGHGHCALLCLRPQHG